MTDTKRLEEKIKESGITKVHIAKKIKFNSLWPFKENKGNNRI